MPGRIRVARRSPIWAKPLSLGWTGVAIEQGNVVIDQFRPFDEMQIRILSCGHDLTGHLAVALKTGHLPLRVSTDGATHNDRNEIEQARRAARARNGIKETPSYWNGSVPVARRPASH